ncbi:TadE/TadG family type IV pilus assembly protein [Streptomyces sp. G1]|uniref:TadE/TadG family type IV pilus assembly protein n=1 Tax=Streptomyces sp. G1 TaxID=361572 RepID=UPI00202EABD9|nr:TadE/TadG family type IV pilus assembly protein [Streptomyces sp. G1]MCM1969234.1 pilus assembly protein [Streptomyces sp. G1]
MNLKRTFRDGHRDRGQVALEYVGFLPFLLLVALGGIQLGWSAYVVQQAQTAARTAARVEAREPGAGADAGRQAIRPSLAEGAGIAVRKTRDAVRVTVTLRVESVVPGIGSRRVQRTAVMPNDDPR